MLFESHHQFRRSKKKKTKYIPLLRKLLASSERLCEVASNKMGIIIVNLLQLNHYRIRFGSGIYLYYQLPRLKHGPERSREPLRNGRSLAAFRKYRYD